MQVGGWMDGCIQAVEQRPSRVGVLVADGVGRPGDKLQPAL